MDHLAAIRTFLRVAELECYSAAARQVRLQRTHPLVAHPREGFAAPGLVAPPQR